MWSCFEHGATVFQDSRYFSAIIIILLRASKRVVCHSSLSSTSFLTPGEVWWQELLRAELLDPSSRLSKTNTILLCPFCKLLSSNLPCVELASNEKLLFSTAETSTRMLKRLLDFVLINYLLSDSWRSLWYELLRVELLDLRVQTQHITTALSADFFLVLLPTGTSLQASFLTHKPQR